jgi:hypothetical protein
VRRNVEIQVPTLRLGLKTYAPQVTVSSAVKNSLHAVNSSGAARHLKERELVGLLLQNPELVGRQAEALANFHFADQELDRLRHELLNLAASAARLERASVENHLSKQGFGELVERLKAQMVVRTALTGGADEEQDEARSARVIAQLHDPDQRSELAKQRDTVFERYLQRGEDEDLKELLRLNDLIRADVRY